MAAKLPLVIPAFSTEKEEAEWMYKNRDKIEEMISKYGVTTTLKDVINSKKKPVSIRLPEVDIERAKKLAKKRRVPYQSLLRDIITTGLNEAARGV